MYINLVDLVTKNNTASVEALTNAAVVSLLVTFTIIHLT